MSKKIIEHNILFEALQADYLKTKDKKYLSKMYEILLDYYDNLLRNYSKKNHCKIFDWETKQQDMATRTISHYLERPVFSIKKLSSYAYFDFIKVLSKDEKEEKAASLEVLEENNKGRGLNDD